MVFLNGLTGQVSFAGGKVVFNADGTVNIGNGKFTVDKNGNTTMNNVTMNNITANSGTFKGVINADAGLIMKVDKFTANQEYYYLKSETTVLIVQTQYEKGQGGGHFQKIVLPQNPNVGQVLTIINNNAYPWYTGLRIYGNGHSIIPSCGDTLWGDKTWEKPLATQRGKQLIFDGSTWWQINIFNGY